MPFYPTGEKGCWLKYYATTLPIEFPNTCDTDLKRMNHLSEVMEYFGRDPYLVDRARRNGCLDQLLYFDVGELTQECRINYMTQIIETQRHMAPWTAIVVSFIPILSRFYFTDANDMIWMRLFMEENA